MYIKQLLLLLITGLESAKGRLPKVEDLARGRITATELRKIRTEGQEKNLDPKVCLARWMRIFAFMKLVERPIEGWHARSTRHVKRSPNLSTSSLSFELRYDNLCCTLLEEPQAQTAGFYVDRIRHAPFCFGSRRNTLP